MQKIKHIQYTEYHGNQVTMQEEINFFLEKNPNIEIQQITTSKSGASNKNNSSTSLFILYKELDTGVKL